MTHDFGKPEYLEDLPPWTDADVQAMNAEMERWHEIEQDREAQRREDAEIAAENQHLYETYGKAAWAPLD
jgi:hypothetical protein